MGKKNQVLRGGMRSRTRLFPLTLLLRPGSTGHLYANECKRYANEPSKPRQLLAAVQLESLSANRKIRSIHKLKIKFVSFE